MLSVAQVVWYIFCCIWLKMPTIILRKVPPRMLREVGYG